MPHTASAAPAPDPDLGLRAELDGLPRADLAREVAAALAAGRRAASVALDALALRRGPGRLAPSEYLYYRLWGPGTPRERALAFVGKHAQHAMHLAANGPGWHAAAADKLLFHALATGAGLPVPELLAHAGPDRGLPGARHLPDAGAAAALLRDPAAYPLFAKPADGKYSIGVLSADRLDAGADALVLAGGARLAVAEAAARIAGDAAWDGIGGPGPTPAGHLVQRQLAPHPSLAAAFGPRLWSVRALVLLRPAGPVLHRAVAKVAVGRNPADNYWRPGNLLGAVDPATGRVARTVRGSGAALEVDPPHPDTGAPVTGTALPGWRDLAGLVARAARLLPGIRTQSWDVALSDAGPVLLEVNWGGDLNLAQLAHGRGVLDAEYRAHLREVGYRGRL